MTTVYIRNRDCMCMRCRAQNLLGPAVLITLGVLFMLHSYHIVNFGHSLPLLLVVIGCVLLAARIGPTEGHVNPGWQAAAMPPPPQSPEPQQWASTAVPPPPPPNNEIDPQVKS